MFGPFLEAVWQSEQDGPNAAAFRPEKKKRLMKQWTRQIQLAPVLLQLRPSCFIHVMKQTRSARIHRLLERRVRGPGSEEEEEESEQP